MLWEDLRAICTRLSQPRLNISRQTTTPQTHLFALVHFPSHQAMLDVDTRTSASSLSLNGFLDDTRRCL